MLVNPSRPSTGTPPLAHPARLNPLVGGGQVASRPRLREGYGDERLAADQSSEPDRRGKDAGRGGQYAGRGDKLQAEASRMQAEANRMQAGKADTSSEAVTTSVAPAWGRSTHAASVR